MAWKPVDDPEALRPLFSDTAIEATLAGERNADSQDEYRALNLSTGESLVFMVRPGEETIALAKVFSG